MKENNLNSVVGITGELPFDPTDFGFEEYIPRRWNGSKTNRDKDYIIYSPKTEKTTESMKISLCEDTVDFVKTIIGDTVNVYVNAKGHILVTEGNRVNITRNSSATARSSLSITSLKDSMFNAHGPFKRLFLTAKPYASGNAVIFAPSGDRDDL